MTNLNHSLNASRRRSLICTLALVALAGSGTAQDTQLGPSARIHHSAVYDPDRKEILIYGGLSFDPATQKTRERSDLWGWNGSVWRRLADTGVPKYVAPLAFDSKHHRTLMFGGAGENTTDGKLSVLDGESWKLITDLLELRRADPSLTYDSRRDRLVLFGGRNENVLLSDTWEFDGTDWKPTFAAGPSLRSAASMVFDSARGVTVLFGGFRPLAGLGDTWEWNGQTWKLAATTGPGPRSWPAMAYDTKHKRTLLFGGEDAKGHFYSDTWAWNGKTWSRIATQGPPERIQSAMAYDSSRDRVVLFGGVNDKPTHMLNDLWEFDGARWQQRRP
jgi:hypothetical protein